MHEVEWHGRDIFLPVLLGAHAVRTWLKTPLFAIDVVATP